MRASREHLGPDGVRALLAGDEALHGAPGIAVRSKNALQILNLELKRPSQSATLPGTETIAFWTWLTDTMIGIVTATSVYNWSIDGSSSPVKAFDRSASLAGTNIINVTTVGTKNRSKKRIYVVSLIAAAQEQTRPSSEPRW